MLLFSNEILNPNYNFCQRDMQHFDISVVKYINIKRVIKLYFVRWHDYLIVT